MRVLWNLPGVHRVFARCNLCFPGEPLKLWCHFREGILLPSGLLGQSQPTWSWGKPSGAKPGVLGAKQVPAESSSATPTQGRRQSLVRVDLFTLQKAFLALPFREVEQTKPLWKTAAVKPRVELKAWAVTGDPRGEELCHI